jgi:hypothetical protein
MKMRMRDRRLSGAMLISLALSMFSVALSPGSARAVDVGQPAPEFKLPSTFGTDIALSDFRGKKFVLVEFYGADFAPT